MSVDIDSLLSSFWVLTTWVWFLQRAETLCCQPATVPFCLALSPSVHWHACFNIAASQLIFSLGFGHWQTWSDRVLTLNINILTSTVLEHLGVLPGPETQPHVLAWQMGMIIAIVEPQSKSDKRGLAIVFPWIIEKTWKQLPTVTVFQPSPFRLPQLEY